MTPRAFREALRHDLRAALKSRQPETISALRSMIAAIDNAEAVPAGADARRSTNGAIAHSSHGVGSTESPRRELHMDDIRAIIHGLADEFRTHSEHYRMIHQHEAADRLQRQAKIMRTYEQRGDLDRTGGRRRDQAAVRGDCPG